MTGCGSHGATAETSRKLCQSLAARNLEATSGESASEK